MLLMMLNLVTGSSTWRTLITQMPLVPGVRLGDEHSRRVGGYYWLWRSRHTTNIIRAKVKNIYIWNGERVRKGRNKHTGKVLDTKYRMSTKQVPVPLHTYVINLWIRHSISPRLFSLVYKMANLYCATIQS